MSNTRKAKSSKPPDVWNRFSGLRNCVALCFGKNEFHRHDPLLARAVFGQKGGAVVSSWAPTRALNCSPVCRRNILQLATQSHSLFLSPVVVSTVRRSGMMFQTGARSPALLGADRARHKVSAAIWADIRKLIVGAICAERALVTANSCICRRGRQVAVT